MDFTGEAHIIIIMLSVSPCGANWATSTASFWILPTRIGYSSNTNYARRFQCDDNDVAFTHVQPHYYLVRHVEPCHQLG